MRWLLFLHMTLAASDRILIFEDDFSGDGLNETIWEVNTGNGCDQGNGLCGWGNFERQTYTLDNHQVADGVLSITANREEIQVDERWYTSSRIRSKAPFSFLTGRIEASIRVPSGQGLWAAFWMLPSNGTRGNWAATGEIDIMEAVNDMTTVLGTIHYGGEYPANRFAGCQQSSGRDYSSEYHTYALEWEQDEMRWYVDDQLYCERTKWTSDLDSFEPYRAPFDTEFELLLNVAVGGSLPGRIVDDTIFPATMLVDFIRVYNISTEVAEAEPYLGLPLCLPGTIEAEAFDIGGLGLGYGELQREGEAGTYRMDGVGLVDTDTVSGRTFLGNLTDGDWTAYTVLTEEAVYDITFQVSTVEAAALQVVIGDGLTCAEPGAGNLTGIFAAEATGDNGEWGVTTVSAISIPAGTHSLKLCVTGGVGLSVDSVTFTNVDEASASTLPVEECATSGRGRPYMFGEPWAIPGYIEAEYYDRGGMGVGHYDSTPTSNLGDATLRWPDGVDVMEAESNPAHGHYVGDWQPGEWLAFTSRAEEGGFWDVGASVASGINGSTIEFRLLVNATNCSSPETDGFNGLGDGIDLLGGPVMHGDTGSWEAFEMATREEVWVPKGDHRVLFCSDSDFFNLNYLRIWTPAPTPAPTQVPTPAPTPAPQVPGDDGDDTKWIYISIGLLVGLLAFGRLGWIIYKKEDSKRAKAAALDGSDTSDTSKDPGDLPFALNRTPPTAVKGGHGSPPEVQMSTRQMATDLLSIEGATEGMPSTAISASAGAVAAGHYAAQNDSDNLQQQQRYRSMFPETSTAPRLLPRTSSASKKDDVPLGAAATFGTNGTSTPRTSFPPGTPERRRAAARLTRQRSTSSVQPLISPVESILAGNFVSAPPAQTPRAHAGLEVQTAGSLWDHSTISPIQQKPLRGASALPAQGPAQPERADRDQFEEALVRALDKKWEGGEFGQANPMRVSIARANSYTEGVSGKSAMLAAGRCWTCVCDFENSVGQDSCLGCGRIAPIHRVNAGSPKATRKKLPPHRMHSWIPPPTDV